MAELFKVNAPVRKPLFEGVQGENEARSIQFDITPWVEELGDGAVTATAKRSQDSQPYPVTVTRDGTTVTWKPTSTDTAFAGVGSFQLEYTVDSVLAKTCIWSTMVAPSLDPAGDPPDPYDNWLAEMREIAADAIQAAQDAEQSAQDAADEVKNAEAWAVGQRGGVDVPSTDPAYENNAKYWAGQAEDLKDATQAIVDEARADVFEAMDGLHEETTAGSALQLISSNYTEDQSPYLFRKSGGGKSIGNREIDKIVGGSIAWNQLFTYIGGGTFNGVTLTMSNGVITANGTATATVYRPMGGTYKSVTGHVYFVSQGKAREGISVYNDNGGVGTYGKADNIGKATGEFVFYFRVANGTSLDNEKFTPQLFDLTQMFGTSIADKLYQMEQANAGSGVALFRSWFPKDYYAYNTGEIMSVKTSAHEMVGFNQWDEEWRNGYYDQDGSFAEYATCIANKNQIAVLANTTYYFKSDSRYSAGFRIVFYDGNGAFISQTTINGNETFTTPSNCRYIGFSSFSVGGITTYNHDICISLSSDRNGEYQPYVKHTYPLDDIELRGVAKLNGTDIYFDGDTYEADGTVTRKYGVRAYQSGDESLADAVTDGTNTVYKLATPTTETADPFTSPQIVDAYGTERYVDERTVAVPVGHVTKYPEDLVAKLDGLPWDFSSLIAPTEKAYTATRNYTTGALLIVNNTLYKVTANIANGGAITPNTNVTATTLAEVISAL